MSTNAEPSVASALTWWPQQRNVWTPIGWKDHLFRFNVVYNGTIIAEPCPSLMKRDHVERFKGQDFQLTMAVHDGGDLPPLPVEPTPLYKLDGGFGRQSWDSGSTPVLRTDFPLQDGLILRQEIFAHAPSDSEVGPLYAWIQLSVSHVDEVRAPSGFRFAVGLSKVWVKDWVPYRLDDGVTLRAEPAAAEIPGGLAESAIDGGLLISEGGGVRLGVLTGDASVSLVDNALQIELPVRVGASADLLLAMLPADRADFVSELALGREGALAECERFWSVSPPTAATVHTPEPYVNELIARSRQFAEIVAERNPENGEYSFLTGSYGYDCLWATPTSMVSHMFLDLLGHHDVVERHSELFRANQGSVHPPGQAFQKHPGYFSTPKTLTSFDWFCDHGAILHQLAYHALVTDDAGFIEHWLDPIIAGCEFLRDAVGLPHDGIPGLLPPAVATDELLEVSSVWNMGWSYLGLTSAVRLLQRLEHPRAAEFAAFASDFRSNIEAAYRRRVTEVPTWTHPDGTKYPVPQANLVEPTKTHPFGDLTLLDTGAMFLVYTGIMDAEDPLMRSAVEFFRVGPNTKLYGYRPNPIDRPILIHEISSGEPCYSWNVFHSWARGDRPRFLEGLYGLLTGGVSDQTYIASEHRHGMYGNLCSTGLIFWLIRHAVIDEDLVEGEMQLLRLVPLAWIGSEEETVFADMPTRHGPVSLRFRRSGEDLIVDFTACWHHAPERVVLHTPPLPGLRRIVVNGDPHAVSPGVTITLP
ncbi:MAG TPA: hypothetical protein VHC49_14510 [Mycobacteriales bacterium]|nr:hypothetical protein [Mycobacteriales bacterium]